MTWDAALTPYRGESSVLGAAVMKLRLPGQYVDEETGRGGASSLTHPLYYNYNRDYDPATGRYTQVDPIGLAGGVNTYAYVGGNPVSYFDPDGLARQRDPNGQECIDLAGEITEGAREIRDKQKEYDEDAGELPERIGPGERRAETRRGHRSIINELITINKKKQKRYTEECGGGKEIYPELCPIPEQEEEDPLFEGLPPVPPFILPRINPRPGGGGPKPGLNGFPLPQLLMLGF
ncbi:RHS repeat-associated core domain-containing protein [Kiloniella laminariae]|uniref:RHS repeat-associated core domain-containing protein n=1 Tax=Kiloniella laminariae TaxID=454162 RepID=UPI001B7FA0F0|nr:RHS repeat-associated core domain-containing protein [Kiloniella laminariae]